jgi:hypothetical protein
MIKAGDVLIRGGSIPVTTSVPGTGWIRPLGSWKPLNMYSKPMSYETEEIEGAKLAKTPILIYLSRVQYL